MLNKNRKPLYTYPCFVSMILILLISCHTDKDVNGQFLRAKHISNMSCECIMLHEIGDIVQVSCNDISYREEDLSTAHEPIGEYQSSFLSNSDSYKLDSCLNRRENVNKLFSVNFPVENPSSSIINHEEVIKFLKIVIREAISASSLKVPNMELVAKPGQLPRTSIIRIASDSKHLTHDILMLGHNKSNIIEIIHLIEKSPLISQFLLSESEFEIQFPIKFYKEDQLETWEDFEKRAVFQK